LKTGTHGHRENRFPQLLLIVGDFIRYGHEHGIACVARGSAAGSIVTYLLEISNVDPIRYGLLFERSSILNASTRRTLTLILPTTARGRHRICP